MKINAVVVDTYLTRDFLKIALDMVSQCPFINGIYLLSDRPENGYDFVEINKVDSIASYNKTILHFLPRLFMDSYLMVFQWDGFPVNPSNWNKEFLKYDFIGAPHQSEIYGALLFNGGFSLRSPKLLENLINILPKSSSDDLEIYNEPEDVVICHWMRHHLEKEGILFPSVEISSNFSYEHMNMNKNFFGFHGAFNLPIFFTEDVLISLLEDLMARLNQAHILHHLVRNCLEKGYKDLLRVIISKQNEWDAIRVVMDSINNTPGQISIKNNLDKLLR